MIDGLLQYYMNIPDPSQLTDEEWASKFKVLLEIREQENKASNNTGGGEQQNSGNQKPRKSKR